MNTRTKVKVATLSDIPDDHGHCVIVGDREIGLFRVNGTIYAISNVCRHQGGPLSDGWLEGPMVSCPWHNWTFDVTTGACTLAPNASLLTYAVTVDGEDVYVEV